MKPVDPKKLDLILKQIERVIVGKQSQVKQCLACVLAGGHLLLEDVPGVGKTTLSHALAVSLGLVYSRVQFTSDLMPGDVLGSSMPDKVQGGFVFYPGPIFSQVLLADEINRATPKTQSAMLEAMEERQVTSDGVTRRLPDPFFVIATQNPQTQIGTYPLPESQLDRFLMCVSLGYPEAEAEVSILMGEDRRKLVQQTSAVITGVELAELISEVTKVHVSLALAQYVQRLAQATREGNGFSEGLSPRGSLALIRAAKAWAALAGRDHALPDDVKAVAFVVLNHRLKQSKLSGRSMPESIQQLLDSVKV